MSKANTHVNLSLFDEAIMNDGLSLNPFERQWMSRILNMVDHWYICNVHNTPPVYEKIWMHAHEFPGDTCDHKMITMMGFIKRLFLKWKDYLQDNVLLYGMLRGWVSAKELGDRVY